MSDPQVQKRVERAARIFEDYGDFIRTVVHSNLLEGMDADDVFQNFFLSLISHPIPDTQPDVKAYLYRAVVNDIVDAARQAKRSRSRLERYSECHKYTSTSDRPDHIMTRSEQMRRVLRLIGYRLRYREYQAIIEHYVRGLTVDEAAMKMGIAKRTYSQYLWIGLKKIRGFFGAVRDMNSDPSNT